MTKVKVFCLRVNHRESKIQAKHQMPKTLIIRGHENGKLFCVENLTTYLGPYFGPEFGYRLWVY